MGRRERVARQRATNRAFVAEVNARTVCAHCGAQPIEWHNPEHVELNRQDWRIGRMVNLPRSIDAIQAEMDRCTPLCRRCHMAEDGRLRTFSAKGQPGEVNGRAKLTEDNVREIRRRRANGASLASMAREYRVTHRTIRLAVIGETWGHITMKSITFDEIHARVAEHEAAEAARNAPIAVARRAVFELAALLADMTDAECIAILTLIDEEITTPLAEREPAR